jgi:hypothetical protein
MKTAETAQPYEWDWDGAEIPSKWINPPQFKTFSVGVFQWIPKASANGLKRGKVVKRIKGLTANPEEVFQKARIECEERNKEAKITNEDT